MGESRCYNCGSVSNTFYAKENGYSLVKCTDCGLLFLQSPPCDKEISQAHKQGKHSGQKELNVNGFFMVDKVTRYLKVLTDLFDGNFDNYKSWLDVGCGHGEFITAIETCCGDSVVVKGTEPNVFKQGSGRKRGLNITYFDLMSHEEKYDIVSLLNVYSHLPNPPAFLSDIKKLLNKGGEIILETGDTAHFSAKDHYRPFCLPDHISFASEDIVVKMLESLNFEILTIKKYPYFTFGPKAVLKEVVKSLLPQHASKIKYYAKWKKYSQTDMFIRARLRA